MFMYPDTWRASRSSVLCLSIKPSANRAPSFEVTFYSRYTCLHHATEEIYGDVQGFCLCSGMVRLHLKQSLDYPVEELNNRT